VAKKMERLANQNTYDEVLQDFRYWDDPSDQFKVGATPPGQAGVGATTRPIPALSDDFSPFSPLSATRGSVQGSEGSVLPLWKLACEKARKRTVTAMAWSPQYKDLLYVGFGSYDFAKQGSPAQLALPARFRSAASVHCRAAAPPFARRAVHPFVDRPGPHLRLLHEESKQSRVRDPIATRRHVAGPPPRPPIPSRGGPAQRRCGRLRFEVSPKQGCAPMPAFPSLTVAHSKSDYTAVVVMSSATTGKHTDPVWDVRCW
jgi:hypothetical protein